MIGKEPKSHRNEGLKMYLKNALENIFKWTDYVSWYSSSRLSSLETFRVTRSAVCLALELKC